MRRGRGSVAALICDFVHFSHGESGRKSYTCWGMGELRQYFSRRLTARETAMVVVAVVMVAGLGYWGYELVSAKVLEARVKAAMPRVCAAVREQRGELVRAIEAYKAHFGVYPPDHVLSRDPLVVDPATNTLFYELVGVICDRTNRVFRAGGMEAAEEKYVKQFFQIEGFNNCGEAADKIIRFVKIEPVPARQLHDDPDVFALGLYVPYEGLAPEVVWEFDASPWRYVSSAPTNNPGKFDLWIDVMTRYQKVVIGNWKAVE